MDLIRSKFYFLYYVRFLNCFAKLEDKNLILVDFCRILLFKRIILLNVLLPVEMFQKNSIANQF